ncbi:hypothetical protein NP233_g8511 [Leucocoprinus birnbaumii]|uniref:Xylanolytic transcriptional activator regulatory domain-containing protein n=1 Tax=Leucocoprinus birnbaumii TaxID=56174 RepID=A0AAD5VMF8_9AGAR|nr:hypothetical protein NP233_g8511 [Leucocoprinus birnbaumii]
MPLAPDQSDYLYSHSSLLRSPLSWWLQRSPLTPQPLAKLVSHVQSADDPSLNATVSFLVNRVFVEDALQYVLMARLPSPFSSHYTYALLIGILPATKGNKVLMAHAQELSKQVKQLTSRVRELEELLEMRAPHLLKTKVEKQEPVETNHLEPGSSEFDRFREDSPTSPDAGEHHGAEETEVKGVADALGSLAIGSDGQMRYRGASAGAEYLEDLLPSVYDESKYRLKDLHFPQEIIELAIAFPYGLRDASHYKVRFQHYIPSRERAMHLFDIYYEYTSWMYNPFPRDRFIQTFMDPIYGTTGIPSLETIHSHKLAVFFGVLANGALYDETSDDNIHWLAARYNHLARAAVSLDSMLVDASVATCEALFMMIRFLFNSDRSANEERWLITGLAARVAQMIGLQRDSGGWNLPDEEIQRRRSIFWCIWTWDTYTAIVNGRPGCLTIDHTDCKLPTDLYSYKNPKGEVEPGYQNWRTQYCITCLTASADHVFAIKTPPYSALLDLDRRLRSIIPPEHLWTPANPKSPHGWSDSPKLACEQACARFLKESNLLYIHRSYFAQAIRQNPVDPFKHKYAPSVYAVITSARTICQHIHGLYHKHKKIVRHGWYFWTSVYSSCIVLSAVVVECPSFSLAAECYIDLREAFLLYEEGSRPCRSEASLRHMQKLVDRAEKSLEAYHRGHGGVGRQPIDPSEPDTLDVLGGRKSLIVPKSNNSSPGSNGTGINSNIDATSPKNGQAAMPAPAPMPPRADAVEMLNQYYQEAYSDQQRHELYNYVPPQNFSMTLSTHPQGLQQSQSAMQQGLYPAYSVASPNNDPFSPSSSVTHATMLSPTTGEGYPATPSDSVYSSPQFDSPQAYPTPPGSFMPTGQASHLWSQQQQPHVPGQTGHHHQHHYQPQSMNGNELVIGYNTATNGHPQFHPVHSAHHHSNRYSNDVDMTQSDIWSSFEQDFRP